MELLNYDGNIRLLCVIII